MHSLFFLFFLRGRSGKQSQRFMFRRRSHSWKITTFFFSLQAARFFHRDCDSQGTLFPFPFDSQHKHYHNMTVVLDEPAPLKKQRSSPYLSPAIFPFRWLFKSLNPTFYLFPLFGAAALEKCNFSIIFFRYSYHSRYSVMTWGSGTYTSHSLCLCWLMLQKIIHE